MNQRRQTPRTPAPTEAETPASTKPQPTPQPRRPHRPTLIAAIVFYVLGLCVLVWAWLSG